MRSLVQKSCKRSSCSCLSLYLRSHLFWRSYVYAFRIIKSTWNISFKYSEVANGLIAPGFLQNEQLFNSVSTRGWCILFRDVIELVVFYSRSMSILLRKLSLGFGLRASDRLSALPRKKTQLPHEKPILSNALSGCETSVKYTIIHTCAALLVSSAMPSYHS